MNSLEEACIYVDGGHNKFTGKVAFASCVDSKSKCLLTKYSHYFEDITEKVVDLPVGTRTVHISNFNDVTSQQNNGAELMAMMAGLRIALTTKKYNLIYSDSSLVIDYWSKSLRKNQEKGKDPEKVKIIREVISLRAQFEKMGGRIEKISGADNLADLGFHK